MKILEQEKTLRLFSNIPKFMQVKKGQFSPIAHPAMTLPENPQYLVEQLAPKSRLQPLPEA